MKKSLKFLTLFVIAGSLKAQTSNFTITNNSGSYSITCAQTSVSLTATTLVNPPVAFHWLGASSSYTGANVTLTQPGTYTVTAVDSLNMVFATQYITISVNTITPVSAVTPVLQNISCGGAATTVSSSASGNMSHTFVSPYGGSVLINSGLATYTALGPGTYTHILLNNTTGCQSSSTFTLTSSSGFPTFSLSSPQNFTLGCGSLSVASIHINNASTSPTAGGAISYSIVSATGAQSTTPAYTLTIPGLYYVLVRDLQSNCTTQIPLTILSNTSTPNMSVSVPNQILSCDSAQVLLQAFTTTSNTSIKWDFIGTPSTSIGTSFLVHSNPGIPSATLVNTYTITITDLSNSCKSMTVIPIYQNLFAPKAVMTPPTTSISCNTPSITLVNMSSSNIPPFIGFPATSPVIGYLWEGPSPQPPLQLSSTYTAYVPGIYTLTVKDLNNGCTSQTTTIIVDNRIFPGIVTPTASIFLPCPGIASINAVIFTQTTNETYTWTAPSSGGVIGNTNTPTLTVNSPGDYTLTAQNNLSGCKSTEVYHVYACVGLSSNTLLTNIQLFPNPGNGIFTIVSEDLQKTTVVEIYNSIGVLVKKQILNSDKTIVNMEGEAAGIYILHLTQNNSVVHTSKIVKE